VVVPQPVARQTVAPRLQDADIVMADKFALEKHNYRRSEIPQIAIKQTDAQLNSVQDWQKAFIYSEIFNRKY
jgi:hypothetical protein